MKIETRMAEMRDPAAKFIQCSGAPPERDGDFHAFAKIESLQRGLARKVRIGRAKVAGHTAQIPAEGGDRNGVAHGAHSKWVRGVVPGWCLKTPCGR